VGIHRWFKEGHKKITQRQAYQKAIEAVFAKKNKNPSVPKLNRAYVQPDGQFIWTTDEPTPERDAAHLESVKKYIAKEQASVTPVQKKPSTPSRKR
jgi:hypothetical protein